GRYFIFSSNKLGFDNFELFMVDTEGTKEPVRVTYTDGFDGLPVPSPDGKQLAWTSTRGGGSAGQLFLAQWNHEKALEALASAPSPCPSSSLPARATAARRCRLPATPAPCRSPTAATSRARSSSPVTASSSPRARISATTATPHST